MAILRFLGSQPGRIVRIVVGIALIAAGVLLGGTGLVLTVVGLLPLAAGVFDFCMLGPLFRLPVVGSRFREAMGAG
ncbi:MAG: YgaP-like transmembrane domain [Acidimicrobiales bacterium]